MLDFTEGVNKWNEELKDAHNELKFTSDVIGAAVRLGTLTVIGVFFINADLLPLNDELHLWRLQDFSQAFAFALLLIGWLLLAFRFVVFLFIVFLFPVTVFLSSPELKKASREAENIDENTPISDQLRIALFGVGIWLCFALLFLAFLFSLFGVYSIAYGLWNALSGS